MSQDRCVSVTVSGQDGVGKSAVALLIRNALAEHGVVVELCDGNGIGVVDEGKGVIQASLFQRLDALRMRNLPVRVETFLVKHEHELTVGQQKK